MVRPTRNTRETRAAVSAVIEAAVEVTGWPRLKFTSRSRVRAVARARRAAMLVAARESGASHEAIGHVFGNRPQTSVSNQARVANRELESGDAKTRELVDAIAARFRESRKAAGVAEGVARAAAASPSHRLTDSPSHSSGGEPGGGSC